METNFFNVLGAASPIVAGIIAIVWLLWRLFWKVDRRSQQEVINLDKKNKALELEVSSERRLRFDAETARARAEAREVSLETQIHELSAQVQRGEQRASLLEQQLAELRDKVRILNNELRGGSSS